MEALRVFFTARGLALPEEGVVFFPEGAAVSEPHLLQAGDVHAEPGKLFVDYGGLSCIINLLDVS